MKLALSFIQEYLNIFKSAQLDSLQKMAELRKSCFCFCVCVISFALKCLASKVYFFLLQQDHDRRVREATQQSFEQLILKVKKHLAPYLKSIMGYWLIAQCDTYSPAASAAKEAFEKAFPSSKQPEALAFCKDEILNVSWYFFKALCVYVNFYCKFKTCPVPPPPIHG